MGADVRFVSGGVLVGDDMKELQQEANRKGGYGKGPEQES